MRAWWVLAILAACADSPDRRPVELGFEVPGSWEAGQPAAEPVQDNWWETFGEEGLVQAVQEALTHNTDLQVTAARLLAAEAQARIAGADLYPQIDAGINARRTQQNFVGFPILGPGVPSRTFSNYGVSFNLSWELDLWGRISSGQSAALADVDAAAADLYAAQLSLIAQTSKAWFAVAEGRRQLQLADDSVESFRSTSVQVRDRFEQGVRPPLDLRLALTNLAGAEAVVALRREQLDRAIRQLELLMGRYPAGGLESATLLPDEFPPVPAGLPSELLLRRPDLLAAERRLAAADSRLDQARASLYPRISLTAAGGTATAELQDVADTDFRVWSLAGNLLQPIFQGGRLRAEVSRNEALISEAVALYASAVQRAFSQVESALAAEGHLALREDRLREAADQAAAALQLSESRYLTGLSDFLLVSDTQRTALNAESSWLAVRRERLDVRIDLFLALGGGFASPTPTDAGENPEVNR
jgi:NodT family efflux transporter outer membrane factor (OMF) lipoprotein